MNPHFRLPGLLLFAVLAVALSAAAQPASAHGLALALPDGSAWLTYTTPSARRENNLTLRVNGAMLELLDGTTNAILRSRPLARTTGVFIQGADGAVDDTLTVDLDGGALALPEGIHFDGGVGGFDSLIVQGGQPGRGGYLVTGPGAGIIRHDDTIIIFSNLEPLTDTVAETSFTVNATTGADTINIVDGPPASGFQTTQVNFGGGGPELINFANKTNVTVNGLAGNDTITLNVLTPATGLSKLVVDAGGDSGDSITIAGFNLPSGTLSLKGANTIGQSASFTVGSLAAQAASGVDLKLNGNNVATVAGSTTGSGAAFQLLNDVGNLTVGTVDGVVGITTNNGAVTPIENRQFNATLNVSSIIHTGGGSITLYADNMTLSAALDAGGGTVYLDTENLTRPLTLGSKPGGTLGLSAADLNQVSAAVLRIGDDVLDSGGLSLSAAVVAPGTWSTLDLRQQANISAGASGSLTVPYLALRTTSAGAVTLGNANKVSALAAALNGTLYFADVTTLTVGTVAGLAGIVAGDHAVTLAADNMDIQQQVNAGSGSVTLRLGLSGSDGLGGATIRSTIAGANPSVLGVAASDALLIDFTVGAALPNGLTFNGGSGSNTLNVSDAGGAAAHTYAISGTVMTRDGASTINYTNVLTLTASGGVGADTFNVTPSAATIFVVNGNAPTDAPGDALNLDLTGVTNPILTATGSSGASLSGRWTFGNRQPVSFTGIESLPNLARKFFLPLVVR